MMTRNEWKAHYRKYRLMMKCITSPQVLHHKCDRRVSDSVWSSLFQHVYRQMDPVTREAVLHNPKERRHRTPWELNGWPAMRCNVELLPNSYPRKTRNP